VTALVWDEPPIAKRHAAFDCGDPDLNLYLQKHARQNHESGGAKCFIAAPSGAPAGVLGFYTLSPASIEHSTPALAKKGLARCDVHVFRLGRLAVDRSAQGRGLGGALLLRAADRCMRVAQDVGGVALLIDARNDRAARWYESYGALRMDDAPLSLVLPLATAADALKRGPYGYALRSSFHSSQ
jgi:ribosomal protein S18 acetylase RimI-like enzyme